MVTVEEQPPGVLYIIVAEPEDTPVVTPVVSPTVAIVVALLLQVPPVVMLLSVVVLPSHTMLAPIIAVGTFTVAVVVVTQPNGVM
jgi:hypothetical protein